MDEARRALTQRFASRGATFLELARRTVYASATSPYARLLRHAGCGYADLEHLVRADGVEGALRRLLDGGRLSDGIPAPGRPSRSDAAD
ncbi:MAG TPA: hypothetical protein VIE44_14030 [Methylomirabilota bacterium]